jgi:hypothetical protein
MSLQGATRAVRHREADGILHLVYTVNLNDIAVSGGLQVLSLGEEFPPDIHPLFIVVFRLTGNHFYCHLPMNGVLTKEHFTEVPVPQFV